MKLISIVVAAIFLFPSRTFAMEKAVDPDLAYKVFVHGSVEHPGRFSIMPGGRLADALIAAQPNQAAYLQGMMFHSQVARDSQVRLRAGLMHDLREFKDSARTDIREAAAMLDDWIKERQVTGRVRSSVDVRLMQVRPPLNPLLQDGDIIHMPERPKTIRVMGAVRAECRLIPDPLTDAKEYLRSCPPSSAADRNYIYVVQPDGLVQKLGIAAWNRANLQSIAPGGTLFVPLIESATNIVDAEFNSDFAAFIATQPITP